MHFFMLPDQVNVYESLSWKYAPWEGEYNWASIEKMLVTELKLHPHTFAAVGIRSADNQQRARMVEQNGPLGRVRHYWWAIWDWKLDDVIKKIQDAKVKLSRSYRYFGSTGDNLNHNVLQVYKSQMPKDYEIIKRVFPLVEAEFFRRSLHGYNRKK
jgi:hypothetical protein